MPARLSRNDPRRCGRGCACRRPRCRPAAARRILDPSRVGVLQHPVHGRSGGRLVPVLPRCSSSFCVVVRRRNRAGSQAAPSRTVPRRCPCARRKAALRRRSTFCAPAMPLRAPESAADKSSATPAPTSGARNSHAAGSGERSCNRRHDAAEIRKDPSPPRSAPASARMAPASALPVRRLVHGAAELRRRDKLLRNKQRQPPGRRRTIRDNANEARPGNDHQEQQTSCCSRQPPELFLAAPANPTGAQPRAPVCQPAAPIHRPRQVNTQTSTGKLLETKIRSTTRFQRHQAAQGAQPHPGAQNPPESSQKNPLPPRQRILRRFTKSQRKCESS